MDQSNLLRTLVEINGKSRPMTIEDKDKKRNNFESINPICKGRELTLNAFKSRIFPITQGKRLKILTPTQILQRLPIALAKVKAGKTSNILLNEIRQIICSLY